MQAIVSLLFEKASNQTESHNKWDQVLGFWCEGKTGVPVGINLSEYSREATNSTYNYVWLRGRI